jgi:hypothetical protein
VITVNLQSGGTYSIEENIVANIKSNSGGCEIVVVEAEQLRSIFSSQSPATVAGLSPYFLSLTNIQRAEVVATIGYSGLSNTVDFVFNIGAGRWSKLTDNGTNSLTAVAQLVQNITVGQAITSDTGFAKVSSVSYTYPSNTIYLNALRIKDVTALGFYGGSLVKYDEGGADFAEYEVGIAPATLVTQINAIGGGSGWGLSGNSGTDYTVNFIGTTDNEPLSFRTNNVARLGFDENGGAFSTTDVFNQAGSYSILQWSTNAINQKIYVSDALVTSVGIEVGSVTTLIEDTGAGIFNQTIVSEAEILLSASGTGAADIHVYPNGEIGIGSTGDIIINSVGGGNIGIGVANPAAILDVTSTTSAFLPPRMTGTQRDAIATPVNGMILYNTTTDKLQVRAAGAWVDLH